MSLVKDLMVECMRRVEHPDPKAPRKHPCARCIRIAEENPNYPELQTIRECESWERNGVKYHAGLCVACGRWEREQRERLRREQVAREGR